MVRVFWLPIEYAWTQAVQICRFADLQIWTVDVVAIVWVWCPRCRLKCQSSTEIRPAWRSNVALRQSIERYPGLPTPTACTIYMNAALLTFSNHPPPFCFVSFYIYIMLCDVWICMLYYTVSSLPFVFYCFIITYIYMRMLLQPTIYHCNSTYFIIWNVL